MSNRKRLPSRGGDDGGHLLPTMRDTEGHNTVVLVGPDGPVIKRVCDIVAEAHIKPRPPGHQVEHINGDLSDDRAVNLRWVPVQP